MDRKKLRKVEHEGNYIVFQGPGIIGTYDEVARGIEGLNLKVPNMAEKSSLLYDDLINGNKDSQALNHLESPNSYLWGFTGRLFLPKSSHEVSNGVLIDHKPKFDNGYMVVDKNELVNRLYENDASVDFVPFGFKTGVMSLKDFQSNPYVIGLFGEEGAEKLADVAAHYSKGANIVVPSIIDDFQTDLVSLIRRENDFNKTNNEFICDVGVMNIGGLLNDPKLTIYAGFNMPDGDSGYSIGKK